MANADGLIIFLRRERMFKTKCVDCGGAFSFFKKKNYGCLTCVQTVCVLCIPSEAIGKGDVVQECRRCQNGNPEKNMTILKMEEEMKKIQFRVINLVADHLDISNTRIIAADIAMITIGTISCLLSAISFGLSFVTFGSSLTITIVGSTIAGTNCIGLMSSQISRIIIGRLSWRTFRKICSRTQIVKEKRLELALKIAGTVKQGGGAAISVYTAAKAGVKLASIGDDVTSLGQVGETVGKLATRTSTAQKTLFSSLEDCGRFGGAVVTVAGVFYNIYTIVDLSLKLHKKKPAEAAQQMRRLADRLLGPAPPTPCERRLLDREFSHQRALF